MVILASVLWPLRKRSAHAPYQPGDRHPFALTGTSHASHERNMYYGCISSGFGRPRLQRWQTIQLELSDCKGTVPASTADPTAGALADPKSLKQIGVPV